MEYRSNEVRAGCLVIAGIILLVAFLILISGLDLFTHKHIYYARFKYTSGVEVGSLVRFGGMEVGRVKKVFVAPDDNTMIQFELEINAEVPVKTNSQAIITSIGIMGDEHIEISTGSPEAALLPSGSLLNCKDVTPLMMLTDSVDQLSQKLSLTIDHLNQILGQENQSQIQQLLVNLNQLLADNQRAIGALMANSSSVVANLNHLSGQLDTMLIENQDSISRSIRQLEALLTQSQQLMQTMQQTLANADQLLTMQSSNYGQIMDNLQRTTQNLNEFSRSIKERPWSLIRKSAPPEREVGKE